MIVTENYSGPERRRNLEAKDVGKYTPGIRKLEKILKDDLDRHDRGFAEHDGSEWQVLYSLLNHCVRVSTVCGRIGRELRLSEDEILVLKLGGLFHDSGKLSEAVLGYRLNRDLTDEERAEVDRHPELSESYIMSLAPNIRHGERMILTPVSLVARYHHEPCKVRTYEYLLPCLVVYLCDIFVSAQEDRWHRGEWRLGISQFQAVTVVKEVVERRRHDEEYTASIGLMERIRDAIANVYGPESINLNPDE